MSDQGDGVALMSTRHPYLITDDMNVAGLKALQESVVKCEWSGDAMPTDTLRAIYTAMRDAEPPELDFDNWPPEDSIETVEIEIIKR